MQKFLAMHKFLGLRRTSIKTRIETNRDREVKAVVKCLRRTSIKTRIETPTKDYCLIWHISKSKKNFH